jgi:hypothetical protein
VVALQGGLSPPSGHLFELRMSFVTEATSSDEGASTRIPAQEDVEKFGAGSAHPSAEVSTTIYQYASGVGSSTSPNAWGSRARASTHGSPLPGQRARGPRPPFPGRLPIPTRPRPSMWATPSRPNKTSTSVHAHGDDTDGVAKGHHKHATVYAAPFSRHARARNLAFTEALCLVRTQPSIVWRDTSSRCALIVHAHQRPTPPHAG